MNDRELLEAAAKAAGFDVRMAMENGDLDIGPYRRPWNPLTDDGDALRLAVKLKFTLDFYVDSGEVNVRNAYCDDPLTAEFYTDDPYAATRRAIVRAAAELAKEQA